MARPHEPHADALRIARRIVDGAGSRLAEAVRQDESQAIADACHDLVVGIAQAIVDAERAAADGRRSGEKAARSPDAPGAQWRSWPATLFGASGWASLAVAAPKRATRGTGPRD
jgi:hypothetical protein